MTNEGVQRRLAAILAADVVGYSRLMEADETRTLDTLRRHRTEFIEPQIATLHGHIVKLMGDGALVEFPSAIDAVQCALAVQRGMSERNDGAQEDERIVFRIGINVGDTIIEGDDIYGSGVNVAARLEGLAEPGGILISGTAYDQVEGKLDCGFEFLGEKEVKNIVRPVRAYRVLMDEAPAPAPARPKAPARRWIWPAVAAALLIVGGAGVSAWLRPWQSAERAGSETASQVTLNPRRIAVLPLANISADPEDEYFSDGMTEELISKLSRLRDLTVIARTSVMQYKATNKSIAEIGRQLQVGTILEGSVRKAGDRLRITAQLIDVASQAHLWSEDYDRELQDVFTVQSDVAQQVANALQLTLMPGEKQRIARQETKDLEAYNLYLKGVYHWHKLTRENLEKAEVYFQQAIERDPTYAQAYAWLAYVYQVLGEFGHMPAREAYPKAKSTASKVLEIDPTTTDAYSVLATVLGYYDWAWEESENAYKKAIELNPNSVVAHWTYGILLLTPLERHDEAVAELERALELAPLEPWIGADLAAALYYAGRYEQAMEQSREAVELDPNFPLSRRNLAWSFFKLGDYEAAFAEYRKYAELTGGDAVALGSFGWAYGVAGHKDEAQEILNELEIRAQQEHVDPLPVAWLNIGLDDQDAAFDWLEKAYNEKSSWLIFLSVDPYYEPLRSDPRYEDLAKRIGLEPSTH